MHVLWLFTAGLLAVATITIRPVNSQDQLGSVDYSSSSSVSSDVTYVWRNMTYVPADTTPSPAVQSTPDPQIIACPSNQLAFSSGENVSVSWTPPSLLREAGGFTRTSTHCPGSTFPPGETGVLYIFIDELGRPNSTCQFVVTVVVDTERPIVEGCPFGITDKVPMGTTNVSIVWEEPSAYDSNEVRLIYQSHNPGDMFFIGTTPVTYEYEDLAGNRASCSFSVTVIEERFDPITVLNCPVNGISLDINFTRPTLGHRVGFTPIVEGPETRVSRVPSDDSYFSVGVTPVVYTFTDVNNEANTATCEYNATIIPRCPGPGYTLCHSWFNSGPVCIPTLPTCESEGSGGVPRASDARPQGDVSPGDRVHGDFIPRDGVQGDFIPRDGVQGDFLGPSIGADGFDAREPCHAKTCGDVDLLEICTEPTEWLDAPAIEESGIFVATSTVPDIDQEPMYLTAVRVAWGQFNELYSQKIIASEQGVLIFVDVSVPRSFHTTQEAFWVLPGLTRPNTTAVFLQVPLPVRRGDIVTLTVSYEDNRLTGDRGSCLDEASALFIQTKCMDCVSVQYRTRLPTCGDDPCLQEYLTWRRSTLQPPTPSGDFGSFPSCNSKEHDQALKNFLDPCLPLAEFEFVSSNQSSLVGDRVVLFCAGTPLVQPLVEWYDEAERVVASGVRSASLEVTVRSSPQSFTCVLDGSTDRAVVYDSVTTVSAATEECANILNELRMLPTDFSECFSLSRTTGRTRYTGKRVLFGGWQSDVWIYQIKIPASLLFSLFHQHQLVEGEAGEFVPVVLEIRRSYGRKRKRRGLGSELLDDYRKEYDPVYIAPDSARNVTFDLDPPLPANSSHEWVVEFYHPVKAPRSGERNFGIGNYQPEVLSLQCSNTFNPICTDRLVRHWSNLLQQYSNARCNTKDNSPLLLESYKHCRGISTAGPRLVVSPSSVDFRHRLPGTGSVGATLDCYMENAVEYRWYRTAPATRESFIKTGNQLAFPPEAQPLAQGAYVCEGVAGRPFETLTLRTEPATFTNADVTTFKGTMRLLNRSYTDVLADEQSRTWAYSVVQTKIQRNVYYALSDLRENGYSIDVDGVSFIQSSSSIIAEFLIFIRRIVIVYESSGPANRCLEGPCDRNPTITYISDALLRERAASLIKEGINLPELMVDPGSIDIVNLVSCPEEVDQTGNLIFSETRLGATAQSVDLCPLFSMRAGIPRASRLCVGDFKSQPQWEEPILLDCFEGDINEILTDLVNSSVTPGNAEEIAKEVVELTSNASAIGPQGITAVAGILEKLVAANSTTPGGASNFFMIVNNILEIEDQATFDEAANDNSPSRIVVALESLVTAMQLNGDSNFTEVQSNIAVVAVSIPKGSLSNGLGFASLRQDSELDDLTENQILVLNEQDPQLETEASIFLPGEILERIPKGDTSQVPISFFLYQTSKLFRSPTLSEAERPDDDVRRAVGSRVIAATVEGERIENLDMPVTSTFNLLNVSNANETVAGAQCVFWDFTLNDNFGDWSSEGCRNESVIDGVVRCLCDHLTSFAVIMDIHGQQESHIVLDVISKIGCAVSVIALLITLITYLVSKKLRSKVPQQNLISLCFALLGLYFIFLVGIDATGSGAGCIIVAVLIHYFTLASIAWMAVEASNMYLLFVRVLNANVSRFFLKASVASWGLPLLIIIVVLAADYTEYNNPNYCFLKPGNAVYFGQLLPIGLVLLFNFVVFMLVMRKLTCARKTIGSTSDKSKRQETIRRLQNALAISILLGLTWIFGLLSVFQTANFAFQILFTVFNSLQGLMIFILFCARQPEVRQVWRERFKCKKGAYGRGTVSGTGAESSTRDRIPLSSQGSKSTGVSEAEKSQTQA